MHIDLHIVKHTYIKYKIQITFCKLFVLFLTGPNKMFNIPGQNTIPQSDMIDTNHLQGKIQFVGGLNWDEQSQSVGKIETFASRWP